MRWIKDLLWGSSPAPAILITPEPASNRKAPLKRTDEARQELFFKKIDTSAGIRACHPWTASAMQANGYGQFSDVSPKTGKRTMRTAHTVAWEMKNGRNVPEGKIVLHAIGCTKLCCNPRHLRLGTDKENTADKVIENRAGKRLDVKTVLRIVELHEELRFSAATLAKQFKLDPSTTRRILRGETWSKVTGIERNRKAGGRPVRCKYTPQSTRRAPSKRIEAVM